MNVYDDDSDASSAVRVSIVTAVAFAVIVWD